MKYDGGIAGRKYRVVDNPFNRSNYKHLIGQVFDSPPGYAAVEMVYGTTLRRVRRPTVHYLVPTMGMVSAEGACGKRKGEGTRNHGDVTCKRCKAEIGMRA